MKPTVGRIVHYALVHGPNKGKCRPAMVVDVNADGSVELSATLSLHDGPAYNEGRGGPMSFLGVGEGVGPGTWHWPEREDVSAQTDKAPGAEPDPTVKRGPTRKGK